jgi:membrane protein implicated in regulation of membrane protease activity
LEESGLTFNLFWVLVSALNVVVFIAVVLAAIWVVRRLEAVSLLSDRVRDLEQQLRQLEGDRGSGGDSPPE